MKERTWWRISRRNLGRNRRRTVITATGLAFGYFAVVVLIAWMLGLVSEMVSSGTGLVNGQIQVHAAGYLPDRSVYATIGGDTGTPLAPLLARIESEPGVTAAAPRVYGGGLVSTGKATAAAALMGIDPAREVRVARLATAITRGRLPRLGERGLALGSELARRAAATVGDSVVVVAPASDGSLGNDMYVVTGIFHSGVQPLDAATALAPIDQLQALMALDGDRVHEIAVRVDDPYAAPAIAARLAPPLAAAAHAETRAWTVTNPELATYAELIRASNWIVLVVVFGMAIFGVANTLLMATYERRREFALLLALGAAPGAIVRTVVYEALALGVVSLVAGAAVTVPVLVWWHRYPLDLGRLFGDFRLSGALVEPVLRTDNPGAWAFVAAGALLATALAAALLPAWRAARVPPADTLAGR